MKLPGLRCACGSDDIVALDPGEEPERSGLLLFDLLIDAGRQPVARCGACFARRFGRAGGGDT